VTREKLRAVLVAGGIRPDAYVLDGRPAEEAYVLEPVGTEWAVYYAERGLRSGERRFTTEEEACRFLLAWVLEDPATRLE
jgi:hypothetical protein